MGDGAQVQDPNPALRAGNDFLAHSGGKFGPKSIKIDTKSDPEGDNVFYLWIDV